MYEIIYTPEVFKEDIPALPVKEKTKIMRAIEERLMVDPVRMGKPLRYSLKGLRRLRVGDWRIIYLVDGKSVKIVKIGHRREVYKD